MMGPALLTSGQRRFVGCCAEEQSPLCARGVGLTPQSSVPFFEMIRAKGPQNSDPLPGRVALTGRAFFLPRSRPLGHWPTANCRIASKFNRRNPPFFDGSGGWAMVPGWPKLRFPPEVVSRLCQRGFFWPVYVLGRGIFLGPPCFRVRGGAWRVTDGWGESSFRKLATDPSGQAGGPRDVGGGGRLPQVGPGNHWGINACKI